MMNSSRPVGQPSVADVKPVRLLVIGDSRDRIEQIIAHLCVLGFCDRLEWSDILPKQDSDELMSIMTKKV